jgi:hypothetical protein
MAAKSAPGKGWIGVAGRAGARATVTRVARSHIDVKHQSCFLNCGIERCGAGDARRTRLGAPRLHFATGTGANFALATNNRKHLSSGAARLSGNIRRILEIIVILRDSSWDEPMLDALRVFINPLGIST